MINLPFQNRKFILGAGIVVVLLLALVFFTRGTPENAARPDQAFTLPAFGMLPDLGQAMEENSEINAIAQKLLSYDEVYLFVNYPQVNSEMAKLLFLWIGMDQKTLDTISGQQAIEVFIRRTYGMPADEPIIGNPLLEKNPWGDLFNQFKAALLMQGHGHKIYDGLAYYDNEKDRMVVDANLSEEYMSGFAEFLKTQDATARKKYINNLMLFVRDTKGLKNLSAEDKRLIAALQGDQ